MSSKASFSFHFAQTIGYLSRLNLYCEMHYVLQIMSMQSSQVNANCVFEKAKLIKHSVGSTHCLALATWFLKKIK